MPNRALSSAVRWVISFAAARSRKKQAFQVISMQDHTSPSSLDNAIALQKYGVGQPVRRKEDDTLVRGKGKYTDDFSLPSPAACRSKIATARRCCKPTVCRW
jgi:hypothetical protein